MVKALVFTHSLWLVGVALLLSGLSVTDYTRSRAGLPLKTVWAGMAGSLWALAGGSLFCTGMALTGSSWLERGLWGVLAAAAVYGGLRAVLLPRAARATGQRAASLPAPGQPSIVVLGAKWLVDTELPWMAVLFPFFLFPAPGRELILLGLPLLWLARWVGRRQLIPRTPLDWAIAVLGGMVLISLYATFDINFSLGKVAGVAFGIGFYYALVEWATTPQRLRAAMAVYALAGAGLAVVGLLGTHWASKIPALSALGARLPDLLQGTQGAESGFQPNEVSGALLWIVPVQIAVLVGSWKSGLSEAAGLWLQRMALLVVVAISGGTLLLTQSRGALLALVLTVGLLAWFALPRIRLVLALLLIAGVMTTVYFTPDTIADKLVQVVGPTLKASDNANTIQGRVEIWSRAIAAIQDFPITGMGMNSFRRTLPTLYPTSLFSPDRDLGHAHNHLLQAALDLGLPGLIAYLAIWFVAASLVVQIWRTTRDVWHRTLVSGIGASLLAFFLYGITDAVALGAKPGVFFWALLALLAILWQQSRPRMSSS